MNNYFARNHTAILMDHLNCIDLNVDVHCKSWGENVLRVTPVLDVHTDPIEHLVKLCQKHYYGNYLDNIAEVNLLEIFIHFHYAGAPKVFI